MATKYQYYIVNDDAAKPCFDTNWQGQTFTVSTAHTITSVKLLIYKVGVPGDVTVSIRATSSSLPTGGDLCSGTTAGGDLTTNTAGEWKEITLGAGYALLASTEYGICVRSEGGGTGNCVQWRMDASSPAYNEGQRVSSSNTGVDWTGDATRDAMFEDWGDPAAQDHEKSLSDSINIADSFSRTVEFSRDISESISISDVAGKTVAIVKSETVAVADSLSRVVEFYKPLTDTINMADSVSKVISIIRADSVAIIDRIDFIRWAAKKFKTFTGRAVSAFTGKDFQEDSTTYMRKHK